LLDGGVQAFNAPLALAHRAQDAEGFEALQHRAHPVFVVADRPFAQQAQVGAITLQRQRDRVLLLGVLDPAQRMRHLDAEGTAPASTEASWSLSPSRIRVADGGSASSSEAIISRCTIEASSTISTSTSSGLPR